MCVLVAPKFYYGITFVYEVVPLESRVSHFILEVTLDDLLGILSPLGVLLKIGIARETTKDKGMTVFRLLCAKDS